MSTAMQNSLEQGLRKALPEVFQRLSKDQVQEFCELCEMYSGSRDPEVLDTIVEMLVPQSLGKVTQDADVDPQAAAKLDQFQKLIGAKIRDERLKLGWTQETLAQKAGIKQSHISRLEIGVHTPSDLTIQKIAKALGVEPSSLDPGW